MTVVIVIDLLTGHGRHPGPVRAGVWVGAHLTLAIAFGAGPGMVAGAATIDRFSATFFLFGVFLIFNAMQLVPSWRTEPTPGEGAPASTSRRSDDLL